MLVGMFTKYVLESIQKTELYKPRAPVESVWFDHSARRRANCCRARVIEPDAEPASLLARFLRRNKAPEPADTGHEIEFALAMSVYASPVPMTVKMM